MTQSMLVELRQHLRNFKELILKWLLSNKKKLWQFLSTDAVLGPQA